MRYSKQAGFLIFYGGGKTYLSLQWLHDRSQVSDAVFPAIVFCPKKIIPNWAAQIVEHSHFTFARVVGSSKTRKQIIEETDAQIYIATYDASRNAEVMQAMLDKNFCTVICDESPHIKNQGTKRAKRIGKIAACAEHRAILTGRLAPDKAIDIFGQLLFLDNGETLGRSFVNFRMRYFKQKYWHPQAPWILRKDKAKALAAKVSQKCIQIKKEEIIAELPPVRDIVVPIELPDNVMEKYKQLKDDFEVELAAGITWKTQWAMAQAAKLQQISQGFFYRKEDTEILHVEKVSWVLENIEEMLETGPTIVWCYYRASYDMLWSQLRQQKTFSCAAGGHDNEQLANEQIEAFKKGKHDVILLRMGSSAEGLNLQRACNAVFYGVGVKLNQYLNAKERCHRIGSHIHDNVTYYHLVGQNTIDVDIYKSLAEKKELTEAVLTHIRSH
jgi:SNF2 family DNA or RNA helicase